MNATSRCIAFGEEKGFPILIDGDVDNEDGKTKKSTIFRVTKTSPGGYLPIERAASRGSVRRCWQHQESAEIAVKGSRDAPRDRPLTT